jgi:hypothetical protein
MDQKSVEIIHRYLRVHRNVIVNDHINSLNVETTACHICANDDIAIFCFEPVQSTKSLILIKKYKKI